MFRSLYHNANNKTFGVVNRLASWLFVRQRRALKHTEVVVSRAGQDTYQPRTMYRRPLDAVETLSFEYHKRGLNFNFMLISIKSTIPVQEEAVRQSLAMVSQRQPMLRATVMESPNSSVKYFESVEGRFKIEFCVMDRDIDDKAAIAEELFATTKFHSPEGPLWRTVLLPGEFDASKNSDFWKFANWCSKSIYSDISNGKHLQFISMLEDEWEAFLNHILNQGNLKLANRQRSGHILSNAGQLSIRNHPDYIFRCESVFGGTPMHRRTGTFGNYLGNINGSLNWMTCYDASISSAIVAQSYSDLTWATLEREMQHGVSHSK